MIKYRLLFYFILASLSLFAQQETVVVGKVYEKGKQDVLPFVSIYFKGTSIGITSDFDGNFVLKTSKQVDTLAISYIGYKTVYKPIQQHSKQTIIVEMESNSNNLNEVVIKPGVNPAIRIIKLAQKNRTKNSYTNLTSFDYNTYSKQDVSMNNISDKMKNQKVFAPIRSLFDTVNQLKNEDGKYILPVFISETYSHFYQHNNPWVSKDIIEANTINGYGAEKQSYIIDIIGSNMMQFDFNQNWIRYLSKDFMSPIADNSFDYYLYTLWDSSLIDGVKCYEIRLNLKHEENLGFLGTIWITDSTYALKRIQVELSKNANINFIDRLKIQQELTQTIAGPWIPSKTRTIIDIAQISKNASGFIVKMYTYNSNITVNQQKPLSFFDIPIERTSELFEHDSTYWNGIRSEPYSATESLMVNMIDSVKKIPAVKTYIDIFRLILEGHYRVGKIDLGPYLLFVGYNQVEHLRLRFGFRTNRFFSNNWFIKSYLAYGIKDEKFKYGLSVERIFSHKHWTTLSASTKSDYDILGVTDPSVQSMNGRAGTNLFTTLSFVSPGSRLNKTVDYRVAFLHQAKRDWTYRITLSNTYFAPVGNFNFAHRLKPALGDSLINLSESYTSSAISGELRYAFKEVMISRGIDRIRMQRPKLPSVTISFTHGLKGLLNGQFHFNKFQISIDEHISTGKLGNADFRLTAGKILGKLPYPLLDVARGNSTFIYSDFNYGLMNLYEFVSDEYSHFYYVQHFEGYFTNKIPLINNWRLRNYGFLKMCYGHLSDGNKNLIPAITPSGEKLSSIYEFKNVPYTEIGFGFENIFRFIQVGYVRRITYLNNVNVRRWGINIGVVLTF